MHNWDEAMWGVFESQRDTGIQVEECHRCEEMAEPEAEAGSLSLS